MLAVCESYTKQGVEVTHAELCHQPATALRFLNADLSIAFDDCRDNHCAAEVVVRTACRATRHPRPLPRAESPLARRRGSARRVLQEPRRHSVRNRTRLSARCRFLPRPWGRAHELVLPASHQKGSLQHGSRLLTVGRAQSPQELP